MNTADYTPDAICRSLGLPGFEHDPTLATPGVTLRLLLKPSFHPEVCITLVAGDGPSVASVVAAQTMVWRLVAPGPVLTDRETCALATGIVPSLVSQFTESAAELKGSGIVIDGMPVDTLLLHAGSVISHVTHNVGARGRYASFVAKAIETVWRGLDGIPCKNSLANAGSYAGLELPFFPAPERKPAVRTLVLGSPEDRNELLEALRKRGDG